jgi:hypothetical protein
MGHGGITGKARAGMPALQPAGKPALQSAEWMGHGDWKPKVSSKN